MPIEKLRKKYMEYLDAINNIGFASSEYASLPKNPVDDEELIDAVSSIIDTSKELNMIIEQSPSSIYVTVKHYVSIIHLKQLQACQEKRYWEGQRPL